MSPRPKKTRDWHWMAGFTNSRMSLTYIIWNGPVTLIAWLHTRRGYLSLLMMIIMGIGRWKYSKTPQHNRKLKIKDQSRIEWLLLVWIQMLLVCLLLINFGLSFVMMHEPLYESNMFSSDDLCWTKCCFSFWLKKWRKTMQIHIMEFSICMRITSWD